jgi:uracil-DNA glycosylase family 4
MISGHGSGKPSLMFIADGAQGDDLKSEYALSGYAGSLLRDFCHKVKLSESDVYYTCLVKEELSVKPIGAKTDEYLEGNKAVVEKYRRILNNEINTLDPYLLIPLGELSFNYLTTLKGIRKFRGSVLTVHGASELTKIYKVMPILGPYPFLYQDDKLKYITRIDFNKIGKYLNDSPPPENLHNLWICKGPSALRAFIERSYKPDGLLVFDIETFMGIPTCISLCFDGYESVCIPLLDQSIDSDSRALMSYQIAKLLASPIRKVNQNIKYDQKILERWDYQVNNIVGDTMIAASTLYCEFPKNLGFLTSIYTDLPYFKDEGRQYDPTHHKKEQFYLYNAKDSLSTFQIYHKQLGEIQEQGVEFVYKSLIRLMPIYRRMEDRGLRVDLTQREALTVKYINLFEIEQLKLRRMIGIYNLNPLSHVQMRKVVYDDLGYKPVRGVGKTKSGEAKTDEDSLQLLLALGESRSDYATDILQSIIACRKLHKVIEILELPLYPDSRFRCEFNLAGTETGRSTAGETTDSLLVLGDKYQVEAVPLGHSLQTIGKHGFQIDDITYGRDIRAMFVPTPGYRFVEIDQTTVNRYHVAKQVRHAGERNIQAAGLVTKLLWGLTVKEGELLLKKFHDKQPQMRGVFHKDIKDVVNRTRCLQAPNGRRRDFFGRIDQHTYNEAISQLPQCIVSDQTKFAGILPTFEALPWAHLLTEQHDGILAEVPIGREEEFIDVFTRNISSPIDFRSCSLSRDYQLSIPTEAAIGEDWYELVEVEAG